MAKYQAMAAYAAGLIRKRDDFIPAIRNGDHVWAINRLAGQAWNIQDAHKISILGAMRFAQEAMKADRRAYDKLWKSATHTAEILFDKRDLALLDHAEAYQVLLTVAR